MSRSSGIRLAIFADLPQVFALQQSVPEAPSWSQTMYREFVEPSAEAIQRKALFVADDGERLCGFAAATVLGPEAELESIAVAVASRQSGLGGSLLETVTRWAAAEGAETLRLEVRLANVTARTFYKRKGFQPAGLRRGYYRDPDDDGVLMLLELAASQPV